MKYEYWKEFMKMRKPFGNVTTTQVGGNHYSKLEIQPMEYSMFNNLNPAVHTIIKYVTRYKDKGGVEDLKKALHTLEFLIEFEDAKEESVGSTTVPSTAGVDSGNFGN